MKGIVLAGGSGTRLYPITISVSKQLTPVYDKPMLYYPISTLMLMGIKDILIISTKDDIPRYKKLFGNGKSLGLRFSYKIQHAPNGLAEAFIIGEDFIKNEDVCLILGDNLFHGTGYISKIRKKIKNLNGGLIFGYRVSDPQRYGVVEFDKSFKVKSIEEKPQNPKSNYAVPGLYFYDNSVVKIAKNLKPSDRGELEITDLNKEYLNKGDLEVQLLGRGVSWFDTGTHTSLLNASNFVRSIEERQGKKISCIEEVSLNMGFMDKKMLQKYIDLYPSCDYKNYLKTLI